MGSCLYRIGAYCVSRTMGDADRAIRMKIISVWLLGQRLELGLEALVGNFVGQFSEVKV